MRLTTYSQRTAATRASLLAIAVLAMTILLGTSSILTPLQYFAPALQPLVTLGWFALYLIAIVGLMFVHGINWIFWVSRYRFLLIILLFGTALSVSWSIDPNVSFQRTVHLLGSSFIGIYLGFMIPLTSILSVLSWVLSLILIFSVGAVFMVPELGIEAYEGTRVWRGILTSKNTLGFWAAVGVLLYFSLMARPISFLQRMGYFALSLGALLILFESKSATSLLSLIIGGILALYFFIAIRFQLGFIRMAVMAVLFIAVSVMALANIDTAELIGRSGDLTGRGEVWSQTWKLILQRPLTGYGYGSIWNPNEATLWIQQSLTDFTWVVYHAHNGFLQVASEIGLPLSCIALLMVVQQLIEIFYCQYERQQVGVLFVLGFVAAFLVSNYSEARFLVNRELYWILFLALPISMLRQVDIVINSEESDEDENLGAESQFGPGVGPVASATAPATNHEYEQTGQFVDPHAPLEGALPDIDGPNKATHQMDDLDLLFELDHTDAFDQTPEMITSLEDVADAVLADEQQNPVPIEDAVIDTQDKYDMPVGSKSDAADLLPNLDTDTGPGIDPDMPLDEEHTDVKPIDIDLESPPYNPRN